MEAKKFGKFIAEIRKERKMTQADLAAEIHVTDKAVSRWERGLSLTITHLRHRSTLCYNKSSVCRILSSKM